MAAIVAGPGAHDCDAVMDLAPADSKGVLHNLAKKGADAHTLARIAGHSEAAGQDSPPGLCTL
ncbi:MAG: hypothetical protein LAO30_23745 [Acidobacteriia bacterium]|nr:hypothetical protein [Terriglobia bacterium]